MKGQAINVDWSIGFSLFLVTVLSSLILLAESDFSRDNRQIEQKASAVEEKLIEEINAETVKSRFTFRTNESVEAVPFYRDYFYRSIPNPYGAASSPSNFNFSGDRYSTVIDLGNRSVNLTYAGSNISRDYSTNLVSSGNWINNSNISLKVENPGLKSMRLNGEELLNSEAEFSTDSSFRKEELFYRSSEGNLTVFNGSTEFLVEADDPLFRTVNFSTLYWHADGNNYDLQTDGTVKQGDTEGLTVANSSIGITFMGDMTANVSRPDNSTVRIDIESNSTRIRLHEKGASYGEKRIGSFAEGEKFTLLEREFKAAVHPEIDSLSNLSRENFTELFGIEEYGFNITLEVENSSGTFKVLDRGSKVPLKKTSVNRFSYNLLTSDAELQKLKGRVILWQ